MRMEDRIVIITGGAGGLGKAIAKEFLKEGAKVCLADVNEEEGKNVAAKLGETFGTSRVLFTFCDVTSDSSFQNAFETCKSKFGEANMLVNNAGIANETNMMQTLNVNLCGSVRGTEMALKRMGKHHGGNGGNVINMASAGGIYPFPVVPFYAASKGGSVHYTRSIGDKLHQQYSGVTIQCLCPTFVDTSLIKDDGERAYNSVTREAYDEFLNNFTVLQPEDVVEPLFKLIEEGKPGSVLVVNKKDAAFYVDSPSPLGLL